MQQASAEPDASKVQLVGNILTSLFEHLEQGEQGFAPFWRQLLTMPFQVFVTTEAIEIFRKQLDISTLEILIRVVDERAAEIDAFMANQPTGDPFTKQLSMVYTNRIGELYEEVRNYRGAIPWYERALMDSKNQTPTQPEMVASQHCNLGLALKHAGLFSRALENYNASIVMEDSNKVKKNRDTLRREMKEWTGTSGRLTPGC